jgi:hypothetical protein
MSCYLLPFVDTGQSQPTPGTYAAYGFAFDVGPWFLMVIDNETAELITYRNTPGFDCHALAAQLTDLTHVGAIPDTDQTRRHILALVLDLPI